MANISVAEAAQRLGVGVSRIHKRIADGSLRAERVGSQWVVDELSLLRVAERTRPGRPLSARSAWAIVALAEGDEALTALAPAERARARVRLNDLLALVDTAPTSESDVRRIASALRLTFRNRAERLLRRAADADLPNLRVDPRWESLVDPAVSGIASVDVDGYLAAESVDAVSRAYLLVPAGDADANVVIHVLPEARRASSGSTILVAADLADRRGPREELRAAELLRDVAVERTARKR